MTQWYYADRNRQQQGPVEAHELAHLYHAGQVDGSTLVWRDGLVQWEPLSGHRDGLGLAVAPPPAPAAPAPLALEPVTPGRDTAPGPAVDPAGLAVEAPAASTYEGWTAPEAPVTGPAPVTGTAAAPDAWPVTADSTPGAADAVAARAAEAHASPSAPAADAWATVEPAAYSPYAAPAASTDAGWIAQPAGEVVLAGFWKRVAAYLIDSLIVGIAGAVIGGVLAAVTIPLALSGDAGGAAAMLMQVVIQLVSLVVTAAYYAGFHASRGQATPGKMAIGIKVVRPDGSRISLLRGIGRYFGALLSAVILCIGYLMAAFTERKQGLHDMLCDTLVVDKWAFTEHPEWQRRELGTVTVVVLAVWGVLLVLLGVGMVVAMGALLSAIGGGWS